MPHKSGNIIGDGFVTADAIADDMFVQSRVLNDFGLNSLKRGQKLLIKVDHAIKEPRVQAVDLLNEWLVLFLLGD